MFKRVVCLILINCLCALATLADVTYVGSTTINQTSNANSATLNPAAGSQENDLLIAQFTVRNNVSITIPSGWTQIRNTRRGGVRQALYYRFVPAGGLSAQTFNFNRNTTGVFAITSLRGARLSNPIATSRATTRNRTPATAPSVNSSVSGNYRLHFFSGQYGNTDFSLISPPGLLTDWQLRTGGGNNGFASALFHQTVPTPGNTGVVSANFQDRRNWIGATVLIQREVPPPVGFWRFEEAIWNGTAGEVKSENSGLHGTAFGGATTANTSPARPGNPGTCKYSVFDGIDDHVAIPNDPALDLDTEFTVMAWINPRTLYTSGGNGALRSIFSRDTNFEFHVNGNRQIYWWWRTTGPSATRYVTSRRLINTNRWTHIAIRFRPGIQEIFINGRRDRVRCGATSGGTQNTCTYAGTPQTNNDDVQIGWDFLNGRQFDGFIDEVRIYEQALTNTEISQLMNQTFPCSAVHHYELEHDGRALSCEPETITIKACADALCAPYPDPVSLQMSPATQWVGGNSVSFSGGQTTKQYWNTSAGTALLGITTSTPLPDNPIICNNTGIPANGCTLEIADAGFKMTAPNVTANKTSATFGLQAVEKDPGTGLCTPVFNASPRSVKLWANYLNPTTGASPTAQVVSINGSAITTVDSGIIPASPTTQTLNFDATATAQLTLHYPDAGQMQLNAEYTGAAGTDEAGLLLNGSSTFISSPAGFCTEAMQLLSPTTPNVACNNASCARYQIAGAAFPLRVRAMAWEVDGETGAQFCTGNLQTGNFTHAGITLSAQRAPDADLVSDGTLGITSAPFIIGGESLIVNQTQSEVGRFNFTAGGDTYFGLSLPQNNSDFFGRFVPATYDITISQYAAACSASFSYAGLSLGATKPGQGFPLDFTTTAKNLFNNTTLNYQGAYAKLANYNFTDWSGSPAAPVSDGDFAITAPPNFIQGVSTHTITDAAYLFDSEHAPSNVALKVEALDTDTISGEQTSATENIYRLGRLQVENTYGPEQMPLTVPIRTEYFDGTRYRVNTEDSCTPYQLNSAHHTSGTLNAGLTTLIGPGTPQTVIGGLSPTTNSFVFSAPGLGNTGTINVLFDPSPTDPSPPALLPWLYYDWNGDGSAEFSTGIATFGRYRGSDRVIYWREQRPPIP